MRLSFWLIFTAVFVLHMSGILYFVELRQDQFGTHTKETSAISINLAETLVLEKLDDEESEDQASRNVRLDETEGSKEDSAAAQATAETKEEKTLEAVEKKQIKKTEAKPPTPVQEDLPKPEPLPVVQKKQKQKVKSKDKVQAHNAKQTRKGGTKAKAKEKRKGKSSRVTASRGQVRSYNARVRAMIARHRPRNKGITGVTIVAFGINRNGRLRYLRLVSSSGSRSLDNGILSAIRKASPFPKPPPGMSLRQLSMDIAIRFR